jgi:ATP-binding cassette, subfamily B, bacterial
MDQTPKEKISPRETLRLFYSVSVVQRPYVFLSLLMPVGAILLYVVAPYYAGRILAGLAQGTLGLEKYLVLFGLLSAAGLVLNRIGFQNTMIVQARAMKLLHHQVYSHLLSRSVGFHANRIGGKLVSDAADFMSAYGNLMAAAFMNAIPFLLSVLVGLTIVTINSWQLGLYLIFLVAVTVIWAYIDSRQRSGMRSKRLVASKALTGHLADTIVNAPTVKTFSQEKLELTRNKTLNQTLLGLRIRDWGWAGRSGNNRMAVLLVMQFLMILLIIRLTRANPEMLATGIFAFTYTFMLTNKLFEINALTRIIDESLMHAAPVTNMLREDIEIKDKPGAAVLQVPHGALAFNDVYFAYPDNTQNGAVFAGLSLSVKPGERIGLVGPSGGGKSTLTRLLLRFDDLQGGGIVIDGQDIADVTQESLRQNVSYVPQEPLLFHRSVGENIGYGRPGATQKAIEAAAKKARAHEFIEQLAYGYDTIVGERGVKLSGGQRQRVAIARALLKDAPILVLDEATSALDSESEVLIQEALWELMKNRTAIVVAHRLSTIQRMDRIVVLDDGKITEEGTHKQLLEHKGLYAKLWSHQSGGFLKEP